MALAKHAASEISPDANYPEKLLNVIMAEFHKDKVACRRYMIEYGLLERDGGEFVGLFDAVGSLDDFVSQLS
jgi:hypothetical protein